MCVCVCVLDGEGSTLFASRVLVVIQTAMYLIGYRVIGPASVNHFRCLTDVTRVS